MSPIRAVSSPPDSAGQCRLGAAQPHEPFPSCFCSGCSEARQAQPSSTTFNSGSTSLTNSKPGCWEPVLQETFEKMKMKTVGKCDT